MEEIYTWDDLYSEDSIAPQREGWIHADGKMFSLCLESF